MSIMDFGGSQPEGLSPQGDGPPQTIDLPQPASPLGLSAFGAAAPPDVSDIVAQVRQLADSDPDHEDKLLLEKVTTLLQEYAARQQKLSDQAMGAGPGLKAVRKAGLRSSLASPTLAAAPLPGGY